MNRRLMSQVGNKRLHKEFKEGEKLVEREVPWKAKAGLSVVRALVIAFFDSQDILLIFFARLQLIQYSFLIRAFVKSEGWLHVCRKRMVNPLEISFLTIFCNTKCTGLHSVTLPKASTAKFV